jgi:hypothetical protein
MTLSHAAFQFPAVTPGIRGCGFFTVAKSEKTAIRVNESLPLRQRVSARCCGAATLAPATVAAVTKPSPRLSFT